MLDSNGFEVYAILSSGRSGSTLLRNELAKPREVGALVSKMGHVWVEQNRPLLRSLDAATMSQEARHLHRQWRQTSLYKHEVKYRYARKETAWHMPKKLLLKFPLFAFGSSGSVS